MAVCTHALYKVGWKQLWTIFAASGDHQVAIYCNCHLFEFQSSLRDIRCVATTLTDSNCTSNWVPHIAGEFTNSPWLHSGASTLTECKTACEFDPRCVAVDWQSIDQDCWITIFPNHGHHSEVSHAWIVYGRHYHLVSYCNVTRGRLFTIWFL